MRSIGLNLEQWVKKDLLMFHSSRPTFYGLEMHLSIIHKLVQTFKPKMVVLDPVGSIIAAGNRRDANLMLIRLMDFLKVRGVTAFFTNLTVGGQALERTDVNISSLVDTWLFVRDVEEDCERNRVMYILKSRGMSHSNQLRDFLLTKDGIDLLDRYESSEGSAHGSSRLSKASSDNNGGSRTKDHPFEARRLRQRK